MALGAIRLWGCMRLALVLASPSGFARFVQACHQRGLGLLLDWVPAHFPSDVHGLARFDGTPLFEYPDPREGFHRDWNTLIYNFASRKCASSWQAMRCTGLSAGVWMGCG